MHEERSIRPNEAQPVEFKPRTFPGIPALFRQGMRSGTEAEQVDHHQFAVAVPPRVEETALWLPTHRECFFPLQKPVPIHAIVKLGGQVANLGIVKIATASKGATKEDRGVNRGNFRLEIAVTTLHVEKMKEKSVVVV